jgi:hypothetical protein
LERYPGGALHDIRGSYWEGTNVRWTVDFGPVETVPALEELQERLGGWSARWDCPVVELIVGDEGE